MVQPSKRAAAIMARQQEEQRNSGRKVINQPGVVAQQEGSEHVAHVRDVSSQGIFFFSDFTPDCGTRLVLRFNVPLGDRKMRIECQAEVLRVESNAQGAAVGIAARMRAKQFRHCHHRD
jgi:hypothetical protein